MFHDRSLLGKCFWGFVQPVLEYCSAVWCSAADAHLKLLDRAVSGARFLTEGLFECDIAHRRSVAVLCILYKIKCNPVHPLNGALPGLYVPVQVTCGVLFAHRYTYAPPRCRTSQYIYSSLGVPLELSLKYELHISSRIMCILLKYIYFAAKYNRGKYRKMCVIVILKSVL